MFGSQSAAIQIELDEAKKKVKLVEALDRLERNKDFKLLIEEEFFKQETLRQASCLSDPSFQTPHMQASLIADMRAGATIQAFFRLLRRNGAAAEQAIINSEEELQAIRLEGDE